MSTVTTRAPSLASGLPSDLAPDPGEHADREPADQPAHAGGPIHRTERIAVQRLRTTMAAVRLSFTWLGVRKTLAAEQRTTAARAFDADRALLSASKIILDLKHPAYRSVAAVRSEASAYWRTVTLPFPETGIRLLPQNSLGMFSSTMQTYRERLEAAVSELASHYQQIQLEARQRLGTLFNPADYPDTLAGLFDMEWSVVPIEPPPYLVALSPEVFRQEQARVRERFESAIELAEQAFASELGRLMAHLAERLSGTHDGRPRIFRDSAIENIREFVDRFERLNVRSSQQLDDLVAQARATVSGVAPQDLRSSRSLRESVAQDARAIEAALDMFTSDRPRRTILRRGSGGSA